MGILSIDLANEKASVRMAATAALQFTAETLSVPLPMLLRPCASQLKQQLFQKSLSEHSPAGQVAALRAAASLIALTSTNLFSLEDGLASRLQEALALIRYRELPVCGTDRDPSHLRDESLLYAAFAFPIPLCNPEGVPVSTVAGMKGLLQSKKPYHVVGSPWWHNEPFAAPRESYSRAYVRAMNVLQASVEPSLGQMPEYAHFTTTGVPAEPCADGIPLPVWTDAGSPCTLPPGCAPQLCVDGHPQRPLDITVGLPIGAPDGSVTLPGGLSYRSLITISAMDVMAGIIGFCTVGPEHSDLREMYVSLFFEKLRAPHPLLVNSAQAALTQVIANNKNREEKPLPKELLQNCLRPILKQLAEWQKLQIGLLKGLARLLSLLSSCFTPTLGEKLLEHLQMWKQPREMINKKICARGQEPVLAAAVIDLFHLLPPCQNLLPKVVHLVLSLEGLLPKYGWPGACFSPFRAPLTRFLDRYATNTVEFFLSDGRLSSPAMGNLFQWVIRHPMSTRLHAKLTSAEGTEHIIRAILLIRDGEIPTIPPDATPSERAVIAAKVHSATAASEKVATLHYQGILLVSALAKRNPVWLAKNRRLIRCLAAIPSSGAMRRRLGTPNDMARSAYRTLRTLSKLFILYLKHVPRDTEILFSLLPLLRGRNSLLNEMQAAANRNPDPQVITERTEKEGGSTAASAGASEPSSSAPSSTATAASASTATVASTATTSATSTSTGAVAHTSTAASTSASSSSTTITSSSVTLTATKPLATTSSGPAGTTAADATTTTSASSSSAFTAVSAAPTITITTAPLSSAASTSSAGISAGATAATTTTTTSLSGLTSVSSSLSTVSHPTSTITITSAPLSSGPPAPATSTPPKPGTPRASTATSPHGLPTSKPTSFQASRGATSGLTINTQAASTGSPSSVPGSSTPKRRRTSGFGPAAAASWAETLLDEQPLEDLGFIKTFMSVDLPALADVSVRTTIIKDFLRSIWLPPHVSDATRLDALRFIIIPLLKDTFRKAGLHHVEAPVHERRGSTSDGRDGGATPSESDSQPSSGAETPASRQQRAAAADKLSSMLQPHLPKEYLDTLIRNIIASRRIPRRDGNEDSDESLQQCSPDLLIQLLRLSYIVIRKCGILLLEHRKELIKFAWFHLKSPVPELKQWAHTAVAAFITAFDTPPRIVLQVFIALLRAHTPEARYLVRKAISVLTPTLLTRLPKREISRAVKWCKKYVFEEGHNLGSLAHVWRVCTRHAALVWNNRSLFVPQMVNSLTRLGLAPMSSDEVRTLAVDLATFIVLWYSNVSSNMLSNAGPGVGQDKAGILQISGNVGWVPSRHDRDSSLLDFNLRTLSWKQFWNAVDDGKEREDTDMEGEEEDVDVGGEGPSEGEDTVRRSRKASESEAGSELSVMLPDRGQLQSTAQLSQHELRTAVTVIDMVTNFTIRQALFSSEGKEKSPLTRRCLHLLSAMLEIWPSARVKLSYLTKALASLRDLQLRLRLDAPASGNEGPGGSGAGGQAGSGNSKSSSGGSGSGASGPGGPTAPKDVVIRGHLPVVVITPQQLKTVLKILDRLAVSGAPHLITTEIGTIIYLLLPSFCMAHKSVHRHLQRFLHHLASRFSIEHTHTALHKSRFWSWVVGLCSLRIAQQVDFTPCNAAAAGSEIGMEVEKITVGVVSSSSGANMSLQSPHSDNLGREAWRCLSPTTLPTLPLPLVGTTPEMALCSLRLLDVLSTSSVKLLQPCLPLLCTLFRQVLTDHLQFTTSHDSSSEQQLARKYPVSNVPSHSSSSSSSSSSGPVEHPSVEALADGVRSQGGDQLREKAMIAHRTGKDLSSQDPQLIADAAVGATRKPFKPVGASGLDLTPDMLLRELLLLLLKLLRRVSLTVPHQKRLVFRGILSLLQKVCR